MNLKRTALSLLTAAMMATGFAAVGVVTTATPALANNCDPSGNGPDEMMSRGRAIARAQSWAANTSMTYDQGLCSDPEGNGAKYRHDCSGLVSMAWGLEGNLVTENFWNPATGAYWSGVTPIALDDLRPGDALVRSGHIELFARWVSYADHNQGAYVYSFNENNERVRNPYTVTPDFYDDEGMFHSGQLGKNTMSEMQGYHAIRYKRITEDEGQWATTYNKDGTLRVFARGDDDTLREWKNPGNTWTSLGGSIVGHPSAAVSPDGNLQVFARGGDGTLRQWSYVTGSGWVNKNISLGGSITGDPVATYFVDNSLQVFARGTDGTLRHWANIPGSGWANSNQNMGGSLAGSPAATTDGENALRVLAVGTDSKLHEWKFVIGSGWSPSNGVVGGTNLVGDVSTTITRDRALQVVARGSDSTVRRFAHLNGSWAVNNENLGGSVLSTPAITTSQDSTVQIVARGTDHALHYKAFVWGSGWSSWINKGGSIIGDPAITNGPTGNLQIYGIGYDGHLDQWHFDYDTGTNWGTADWGGNLYPANGAGN
ncbi:hypothetical protein [Catellatospora chokoriensis]|uniref:PLL-like beta propeller domain-containing protein n=1 Tax=Catellatospora chokoriensis TaxID=310353 RepID=A0A8J3K3X6_9ACTN|nr:hypothetical protein [Catellatospora chokoriensis]GIF93614.1 hypothetical protein Cch02nite_70580 [Catellatospora chokoriensis]